MTIPTNSTNQSSSHRHDVQILLRTLETALENLIDHSEKLETLRDRSKGRLATIFAERIGSVFPLTEYVEYNWDTIQSAYTDTPIVEHLVLEVAEDNLLSALNSKPRDVIEHWEECHSACTRALSSAKVSDALSARARASIEIDLRSIHADEREQRWLNGEDD